MPVASAQFIDQNRRVKHTHIACVCAVLYPTTQGVVRRLLFVCFLFVS